MANESVSRGSGKPDSESMRPGGRKPMHGHTLYTVGHSNRSLDELLNLLLNADIGVLVDIRARPQSRRFPHFSGDMLRAAAEQAGLAYHWAGRQLGGLRESAHAALADGLRGFADYMDTAEFQMAAAQLARLAARAPTAILCAERMPEECHRSLIADYLTLRGMRVIHLVDEGEMREHRLRPEARRESAQLIYDRHVTGRLLP